MIICFFNCSIVPLFEILVLAMFMTSFNCWCAGFVGDHSCSSCCLNCSKVPSPVRCLAFARCQRSSKGVLRNMSWKLPVFCRVLTSAGFLMLVTT